MLPLSWHPGGATRLYGEGTKTPTWGMRFRPREFLSPVSCLPGWGPQPAAFSWASGFQWSDRAGPKEQQVRRAIEPQ